MGDHHRIVPRKGGKQVKSTREGFDQGNKICHQEAKGHHQGNYQRAKKRFKETSKAIYNLNR